MVGKEKKRNIQLSFDCVESKGPQRSQEGYKPRKNTGFGDQENVRIFMEDGGWGGGKKLHRCICGTASVASFIVVQS